VEFDFLVHGRMVNSLIQTVSAPSGPAHNISNEVFTRWYDIDSLRSHYQCLTVYDSTRDYVVRPEDMKRLSELSTVIAYPAEEERLKETLLA